MAINPSSSSSNPQPPLPPPTAAAANKPASQLAVVEMKCHSCGFTEDCTPAYISRVQARYHGRWLCGLCVEAVKDEVLRSDGLISVEEALHRHVTVCDRFRSKSKTTSLEDTEHPMFVMGRVLRRSLDSIPRGAPLRSSSSSALSGVDEVVAADGSRARRSLVRSGSCFPSLSR